MKTPRLLFVLLAALFLYAGLAAAQSVVGRLGNGVKLNGDGATGNTRSAARGSVASDETVNDVKLRGDGRVNGDRPGVADDIGLGDTLDAKLGKLDRQRARREAQLARALVGLAADDPKRAAIVARFERKFAQLDAKRARLEARGGDDAVVDAAGNRARREDRHADHRVDRVAERRAERPERAARAERAERPERVQRPERVERSSRIN